MDFNLLKRSEPARAGLHVQRSMDTVLLAAVLVLTIKYWLEVLPRDILERFRTTRVASVRVHSQEGLDFGDARNDASYRDELSEVGTLDVAYCHGNVRAEGLEVQIAVHSWAIGRCGGIEVLTSVGANDRG